MKKFTCALLLHVLWLIVSAVGQEVGFDGSPHNVTAIRGQPAILPCTVLNKLDKEIIWMNPRSILISDGDRRVIDDTRMSIERPFVRDWNLHIRGVQVYDDGEYTCQINTDPIQIRRVLLKVLVPAEMDNETTTQGKIEVEEGQDVELQCVAKGTPEPTITWYRKTPHSGQHREPVVTAGSVATPGEQLIIRNITRYCGGLYVCEASNNIAKPVKRVMNVQVTFSPEVTLRNGRMGQVRERETVLECLVAANPQNVLVWKKGGRDLGATSDNRYNNKYRTSIYNDDTFTKSLYLTILNLGPEDFGNYSCFASNRIGKDEQTMTLYELKPQTTAAPTTPVPQPEYWSPVLSNRIYDNADNTGSRQYPGSRTSHISDYDAGNGYQALGGSASIQQTSWNFMLTSILVTVTLCFIQFTEPS